MRSTWTSACLLCLLAASVAADPADKLASEAAAKSAREAAKTRQQHELAKAPAPSLERFDTDHDGRLSEAERAAMFRVFVEERAAAVKAYDVDGDSKLSRAERRSLRQARRTQLLAGGESR